MAYQVLQTNQKPPAFGENLNSLAKAVTTIIAAKKAKKKEVEADDMRAKLSGILQQETGTELPVIEGSESDLVNKIAQLKIAGRQEENLSRMKGEQARDLYAMKAAHGAPANDSEEFRNDFRATIEAARQIQRMPLSKAERRNRIKEIKRRLLDAYPHHSNTVNSFNLDQ